MPQPQFSLPAATRKRPSRPLRAAALRTLACVPLFCAGLASAQGTAVFAPGEQDRLRAEARAKHAQAEALRTRADAELAAQNKACWEKFLVTRCMDDAKLARQETFATAREMDKQAREIERDLRKREAAEHEAHWAEEEPKREAETAAQAEKNRRERQEAMERVERKQREAAEREGR